AQLETLTQRCLQDDPCSSLHINALSARRGAAGIEIKVKTKKLNWEIDMRSGAPHFPPR
ncbi:hypothetical protein M413DRAFT_449730, partial [Hebeloma cylindrosporum]